MLMLFIISIMTEETGQKIAVITSLFLLGAAKTLARLFLFIGSPFNVFCLHSEQKISMSQGLFFFADESLLVANCK